jgi:DNA-binding transcriptional MerR regulator
MRKTFKQKIGDVSRVTGVSIPMLHRWLDRRVIKLNRNDHSSTGTGDAIIFGRNTINQIAIAKKLIELGVGAGSANAAAALFTEKGNT